MRESYQISAEISIKIRKSQLSFIEIYTYIKHQLLSIYENVEEILMRADALTQQMIERIVRESPAATPQQGEAVLFSRRKPAQSNLANCSPGDLDACYNQIRMLDAEGYPHAFMEINGMRLEFRRVSRRSDGLRADVRITSLNNLPPPHKRRGLSCGSHRPLAIARGQRW